MKYQVLSHFHCNGVEGVKGEILSEEKMKKIGKLEAELVEVGCIKAVKDEKKTSGKKPEKNEEA